MQKFNVSNIINSNAQAGAFKTNKETILKQYAKNARFIDELIQAFCTEAQLKALCTNQKAIMRFLQACNFILSGDVKACEKNYAKIFAMIALSKSEYVSFKDTQFLLGAKNENAQNVAGVSRAKLHKFLNIDTTEKTIKAKVTHGCGKNGILTALGLTVKSDSHGFTISKDAKQSAFLLAYASSLEKMTDGAFNLLTTK